MGLKDKSSKEKKICVYFRHLARISLLVKENIDPPGESNLAPWHAKLDHVTMGTDKDSCLVLKSCILTLYSRLPR